MALISSSLKKLPFINGFSTASSLPVSVLRCCTCITLAKMIGLLQKIIQHPVEAFDSFLIWAFKKPTSDTSPLGNHLPLRYNNTAAILPYVWINHRNNHLLLSTQSRNKADSVFYCLEEKKKVIDSHPDAHTRTNIRYYWYITPGVSVW